MACTGHQAIGGFTGTVCVLRSGWKQMAKPFDIHGDAIAPPLSFAATVKKYGGSAADVAAVRGFFEKTGRGVVLTVRQRRTASGAPSVTIRARTARAAHKSRSRKK
jgi:hypothetical protein